MMWVATVALALGAAASFVVRLPGFVVLATGIGLVVLAGDGWGTALAGFLALQVGYGLGMTVRAVAAGFFGDGASSLCQFSRRREQVL